MLFFSPEQELLTFLPEITIKSWAVLSRQVSKVVVDWANRMMITLISISSISRVRSSTHTRWTCLLFTSKLGPSLNCFFLSLQHFWGKVMWSFSRNQTLHVYFLISFHRWFLSSGETKEIIFFKIFFQWVFSWIFKPVL